MEEMQTQQQVANSTANNQTQTLTSEEVTNAVESALRNVNVANDSQLQQMDESLKGIDQRLQTVAENTKADDTKQEQETVTIVKLDPGQTATAKTGARIVCTEGLVIIILLAVSCGLQLFRILSDRWH